MWLLYGYLRLYDHMGTYICIYRIELGLMMQMIDNNPSMVFE